ncbi:hypothetical protein [Pseudogracilibacillus sp. ICA-222130]|uniref:hypothetical protein n=1 Tax=Pseudogracilibacillus sp. ICA-222130 TaxID=3134655 RepID=UPI0030BDE776
MLKRLVTFGAMFALIVSFIVPTTAVFANEENVENNEAVNEQAEDAETNAETNEETNDEAESSNDGAETNEKNAENEDAAPAETQETNLIYWIVIGYVFVLSVGLYAFTEGTKKGE